MPKKSVEKERKAQIFEAFHNCLLNKSYKNVSTRALAAMAHVNQGMLYYFFKDKEDILLQYIDYVLERYESRFAEWVSQRLLTPLSGNEVLDEAHEFITREISLNREIAVVFVELWSIAGSNDKVKNRLNKLYRQWDDLMVGFLIQYGLKVDAAKKISAGIIAFCEGIAVCLVVMEKDEKEIRSTLDWFKERVVEDIEKHRAKPVSQSQRRSISKVSGKIQKR